MFRQSILLLAAIASFAALPSRAAGEFELDTAPEIHRLIWEAEDRVSQSLTDAETGCKVKLNWTKPRAVGEMSVKWSGECNAAGFAHGAGTLTVFYDTIEIFSEGFDPAVGAMLYEGIPLTTLLPGEFGILQSACIDAGLSLRGRGAGGTFAEYPARANLNGLTVAQDTVIMEEADNVDCGGIYELRVFVRGQDLLAAITGSPAKLDRVLTGGYDVNYKAFADEVNAGIERYNAGIDAVRSRKAEDARLVAAASYADASVPIDNLANFLEAMGRVKSIQLLGEGRLVNFPLSDVSFKSGKVYVTSRFAPASAAQAVEDLQENFSWDGWFDVTVNGNNSMSRAISATCVFETSDLDALDGKQVVIVKATLIEFSNSGLFLSCAPQ